MAMTLISCENCGVVLDKTKLSVPEIFNDEGLLDSSLAFWDGENYKPVISCPCCEEAFVIDE